MSIEHRDDTGARFGMWLFLYTEVILFSGLFIIYAVSLTNYPAEFSQASNKLNVYFGGANTIVLLTSSLTIALAISAIQMGRKKQCLQLCWVTIALAIVFLINKYFEWSAEISHGIYPGSEHLAEMGAGITVFFNLYYFTAGLHGLHVLIGATLIAVVAVMTAKDKVTSDRYTLLENSALYWHLVDLVWIFLFPLYYLIL
ncbi:cytochrome c oxidase subunit 3 [Malonomonas rubra DSM 5091]|uniref:Cytochrome c oxidase subunit 3 n=1 Tax=Malonomonas rubra DSM 5091 TaxID=1122189 RepID=A0A1M6JHP1_MALRU|nr:cytochrome c oxidase subunit 3 family protein [Malonomonas rubra]SHJ46155.1 cytochrome c oxidase subunit 3 [Malonomonas rubra DSM 5091]